ncbi:MULTISPECIES: hypothetical protein, partial [Sphingomonadales]|uniref:hypothetical protein n=1 Tax=Sphingomonadales TaxID=204457 RepID=UPI001E6239D9
VERYPAVRRFAPTFLAAFQSMLAPFTSPRITMTQDELLQWRQLDHTAYRKGRSFVIHRQGVSTTGRKFRAISVE